RPIRPPSRPLTRPMSSPARSGTANDESSLRDMAILHDRGGWRRACLRRGIVLRSSREAGMNSPEEAPRGASLPRRVRSIYAAKAGFFLHPYLAFLICHLHSQTVPNAQLPTTPDHTSIVHSPMSPSRYDSTARPIRTAPLAAIRLACATVFGCAT